MRRTLFRRLAALAITSALGAAGFHATSPAARPGTVTIQKVLDGDTVIVAGWEQRVRLANVDAPEMSHGHGKPGQPYSVQSMRWLANQLEGQAGITVVCPDQDRYGRKVCDFYKGGRHVNKELVRVGLAWANTANPRYLRDRTVLDAQAQAQAARSGLWAEGKPVEPWNWRHECWGRGACGAH